MTSQPLPKANMGLFERRRVEKTASFFRYYAKSGTRSTRPGRLGIIRM